uniref:Uncharacterized protein n=1 Tax=Panagrolaimus sp. JU765 TaxID=591449 RepID=A0AC34QRJ3_9BILA
MCLRCVCPKEICRENEATDDLACVRVVCPKEISRENEATDGLSTFDGIFGQSILYKLENQFIIATIKGKLNFLKSIDLKKVNA